MYMQAHTNGHVHLAREKVLDSVTRKQTQAEAAAIEAQRTLTEQARAAKNTLEAEGALRRAQELRLSVTQDAARMRADVDVFKVFFFSAFCQSFFLYTN